MGLGGFESQLVDVLMVCLVVGGWVEAKARRGGV